MKTHWTKWSAWSAWVVVPTLGPKTLFVRSRCKHLNAGYGSAIKVQHLYKEVSHVKRSKLFNP